MNNILQLNDQLMHMPAGVVVGLFAIVLGYVLKISSFFPNNRIPIVVVCFTALFFPLIQLCADGKEGAAGLWWNIPINLLLGFIIGGLAWLAHAQILRRFVDPKLFDAEGNTKFFQKPPEGN